MKKFFTIFFVVLGVIFFAILLLIAYLFIFDPYNIKPFIFGVDKPAVTQVETTAPANSETAPANSALSPAQQSALEAVGVSPDSVPQNFTPEQISCFEEILGKARVDEIKAGGTPSAAEFFKAKECI